MFSIKYEESQISIEISNELNNLDEITLNADNNYVIQPKYDEIGELKARFSYEKHNVLINEILLKNVGMRPKLCRLHSKRI